VWKRVRIERSAVEHLDVVHQPERATAGIELQRRHRHLDLPIVSLDDQAAEVMGRGVDHEAQELTDLVVIAGAHSQASQPIAAGLDATRG
jgi:hypothetical protein